MANDDDPAVRHRLPHAPRASAAFARLWALVAGWLGAASGREPGASSGRGGAGRDGADGGDSGRSAKRARASAGSDDDDEDDEGNEGSGSDR